MWHHPGSGHAYLTKKAPLSLKLVCCLSGQSYSHFHFKFQYTVCWQEDLVKSPNWVLPMPNHFFRCPYEKPSTTFAYEYWKKFNLSDQSPLIFTKISDFRLFYYGNELSKLSSTFSCPEFQAKTIYTRCTMKKYIMVWWSNGGTPARVKC